MGDGRAPNKTQPTEQPVADYLASVEPPRRRAEAERIVSLLTDAMGAEPVMWGPSIIGWGTYTYRYASGRSGEWMKVGFAPRKTQLTFYGLQDSAEQKALLDSLGQHTTGVGCVYVKRLDHIDETTLTELARLGYARGDYVA